MQKKIEWNGRYIAVSNEDKFAKAARFIALNDYAVYVTLSADCEDIVRIFKKRGISLKKVSFVSIGKPDKKLSCYAATSAQSLAEIAMLAKDLLDSSDKRKKAVVIDSLHDIILANNSSTAEEFMEFLGKSCREWGSGLMIIADSRSISLINISKDIFNII